MDNDVSAGVRSKPAPLLGHALGQKGSVMAQNINRLSAKKVEAIRNQRTARRERIADGGGLYLSVSPNGGHRWVFLYRWRGKPTEIGFGSARDVALAYSRGKAIVVSSAPTVRCPVRRYRRNA